LICNSLTARFAKIYAKFARFRLNFANFALLYLAFFAVKCIPYLFNTLKIKEKKPNKIIPNPPNKKNLPKKGIILINIVDERNTIINPPKKSKIDFKTGFIYLLFYRRNNLLQKPIKIKTFITFSYSHSHNNHIQRRNNRYHLSLISAAIKHVTRNVWEFPSRV